MNLEVDPNPEVDWFYGYAVGEHVKDELLAAGIRSEVVGEVRRKLSKISRVDVLAVGDLSDPRHPLYQWLILRCGVTDKNKKFKFGFSIPIPKQEFMLRGLKVRIIECKHEAGFFTSMLIHTGPSDYVGAKMREANLLMFSFTESGLSRLGVSKKKYVINVQNEEQIFKIIGLKYLEPSKRT